MLFIHIKKILAVILSAVMVLGTGTINVFADETAMVSGYSDIANAGSVIIDGTTGLVTVGDVPTGAADCTCEPVCGISGDMPHLPDCPTLPAEVRALMRKIDMLPSAEKITDEEMTAYAAVLDGVMSEYSNIIENVNEMTEDKLTAMLGTERMEKLAAVMNLLNSAKSLALPNENVITQGLRFQPGNAPADCTKLAVGKHTHLGTASDPYCFTWSDSTLTLTLNGLNLVAPDNNYIAIELPDGATVYTNSDSSVTAATNAGIYSSGAITFDGIGNLVVKGGGDGIQSSGVITINGGTISAISSEYTSHSNGISAYKGVIVNDGTLNAIGGTATDDHSSSYGISGSVSMMGGTLNATGGAATNGSYGISGEVIVNSGKLNATGGAVTKDYSSSHGILGYVTIMDGTLNANGGASAGGNSYGISGSVTVSGGILTAEGGTAKDYSYGIESNGSITVNNGTLNAKGGITTGSVNTHLGSCGVSADSVTVNDGTLTATGTTSTRDSDGVFAKLVTVNGGTLTASGGTSAYDSCGVSTSKGVIVNGGTLKALGGTATGEGDGIICSSYGITGLGGVTVNGGQIDAIGGEAARSSYGIGFVSGKDSTVSVSGGALTATGGAAIDSSYGVRSNIVVSGGILTANGGKTKKQFSFGVFAKTVEISNGAMVAGGGAESMESFGVCLSGTEPKATVSGGTLTATGGKASSYSAGIFVNHYDDGKIIVNGTGLVTATGGEGSRSYGVRGSVNVMDRGKLTATGGAATVISCGVNAESGSPIPKNGTITVGGGRLVASCSGSPKTAIAVNVAPETKDYVGGAAVTASVNASGTPTTDYKAADIATYKYLNVDKGEEKPIGTPALDFVKNGGSSTCLTYPGLEHTHDDGKVCFTWDNSSNKLILSGLELTAPVGSEFAIKLPDNAAVETVADSTITGSKNTEGDSVGILGNGDISFGGKATLNVKGGKGNTSIGISSGKSITIYGGTVKAVGGEVTNNTGNSYGVLVNTELYVNDGVLEASSSATTGTAQAVNKAPDTNKYVGGAAFTASVNASGTPTTDYKATDIATYKYLKVFDDKLIGNVDNSDAGTTVVVDADQLAAAVDTGEELRDPNVTNVKVVLAVKNLDNPADKGAAESILAPNGKIGAFFDITLSKLVTKNGDTSETKPVTEAKTPITITITIPEVIRGYKDYQVIRVHNGNAEVLNTTKVGDDLIFDTGLFSTYAIAYTDNGGTPPTHPVTTGGGSSSSDDGYSYWMGVKQKVNSSAKGDVVKTDAKGYDQLPASVMTALLDRGVGIVIDWNGGKAITIPAGKAFKPEAGRLYYPLSLLEQQFGSMSIVNNTINPETGGTVYIDAKTGTTMPVTGVIVEAPTAETAPNAPIVVTPPTAGMEPEVAATPTCNGIAIAAMAALVAMLAGGIWYYRRNYGTK